MIEDIYFVTLLLDVKREDGRNDDNDMTETSICRLSFCPPTMVNVEIIIRFNKNGLSAKQWTVARRIAKHVTSRRRNLSFVRVPRPLARSFGSS